jgi:ribosomal protein S18 acetylase RimI-like enzyme
MPASSRLAIVSAHFPGDAGIVRALFAEYIDSLGIDLSFQDAAAELAGLPGRYTPPGGAVLLARDAAGQVQGCVALRPWTVQGTCEIKRLYVRPAARGQALGRRLAEAVIELARQAGYTRVLLDTLATMHAARRLYAELGFQPVASYYDNPLPGTAYMALDLD